jgi:hypothetical protein
VHQKQSEREPELQTGKQAQGCQMEVGSGLMDTKMIHEHTEEFTSMTESFLMHSPAPNKPLDAGAGALPNRPTDGAGY